MTRPPRPTTGRGNTASVARDHREERTMLKILSGVLVMDESSLTGGTATIKFDDHSVVGDAEGLQRQTIGGSGTFSDTPCHHVAMREFEIRESAEAPPSAAWPVPVSEMEHDWLEINTAAQPDHLKVTWKSKGKYNTSKSLIREIGYMIIGERKDR
jgi:hypothetical protein